MFNVLIMQLCKSTLLFFKNANHEKIILRLTYSFVVTLTSCHLKKNLDVRALSSTMQFNPPNKANVQTYIFARRGKTDVVNDIKLVVNNETHNYD